MKYQRAKVSIFTLPKYVVFLHKLISFIEQNKIREAVHKKKSHKAMHTSLKLVHGKLNCSDDLSSGDFVSQ